MWGRGKPLYDVWYIIETFPFDREEIYAAGFGKKSLADKAAFQNKHLTRMLSGDIDITTTEGKRHPQPSRL